MADNLSVKITADITDIPVKMALAKAELASLSAEVRKLATQAVSASGDIRGGLVAQMGPLVAETQKARTSLAGLKEAAGVGAPAMERLGIEVTRLGHELSSGELYRAPSTVMRLVAGIAEISPIALAGAAGVAVLGGALGLLAVRWMQVQAAIRQTEGNMVIAGTAGDDAVNKAQGWIARTRDYWDQSTSEANKTAEALGKLHGPVAQYADGILDIANKQAQIDRSSPSENATKWVAAFNEGSAGALKLAESMGTLTTDQALEIKSLVQGKDEQVALNAILAAANGQFGNVAEGLRKYTAQLKEYNVEVASAVQGGGAMPMLPAPPKFASGSSTIDAMASEKRDIAEITSAEQKRADIVEQIGNLEAASLKMTGAEAQRAQLAVRDLEAELSKIHSPAETEQHEVVMAGLQQRLAAVETNKGAQVAVYQEMAAEETRYAGQGTAAAIEAQTRVTSAAREAAAEQLNLTLARIRDQQDSEKGNVAAQIGDQDRIIAVLRTAVAQGIANEGQLEEAIRRRTQLVRESAQEQASLQMKATGDLNKELDKQLQAQIKHFDQLAKEKQISIGDQTRIEEALTTAVLEEEIKRLQAVLQNTNLSVQDQQTISDQIVALKQRETDQVVAIADRGNVDQIEAARKLQQDLREVFQPFSAFFDSTLSAMLGQTKNWNQEVERAFDQLVTKLITEIAELALHWAAFQAASGLFGPASTIASAVGNPFGAQATGLGGLIGSLMGNTSQQSANTLLISAATQLGISATDLMAAAAALQGASASGGATSFLGLAGDSGVAASGSGGGGIFSAIISGIGSILGLDVGTPMITRGGLAQLHAGEMVLPALSAGKFRESDFPAFNPGGGNQGGDTHHHYHSHTHVTALDTRSMEQWFKDPQVQAMVARAGRQAWRNGHPATR